MKTRHWPQKPRLRASHMTISIHRKCDLFVTIFSMLKGPSDISIAEEIYPVEIKVLVSFYLHKKINLLCIRI